jgi:hypothetical protein
MKSHHSSFAVMLALIPGCGDPGVEDAVAPVARAEATEMGQEVT